MARKGHPTSSAAYSSLVFVKREQATESAIPQSRRVTGTSISNASTCVEIRDSFERIIEQCHATMALVESVPDKHSVGVVSRSCNV
jgi:hypothetical protein